jgi:hypothetical protein
MTIDQKLHDHVLAWVDQHPGAECNEKTGKPELVAKFQRHYGSKMTDTAIKAQIGYLVSKYRPSIMPQRTNAGLSAPNMGDPTGRAPSEKKKSNSVKNPVNNLVNNPIYREKSRMKKENRSDPFKMGQVRALKSRTRPWSS